MKYFIQVVTVIGLLSLSHLGSASEVTETFNNGDVLTAGQLNNIKNAVNDNDGRIMESEDRLGAMNFAPVFLNMELNTSMDIFTLDNVTLRAYCEDDGLGNTEFKIRASGSVDGWFVSGNMVVIEPLADPDIRRGVGEVAVIFEAAVVTPSELTARAPNRAAIYTPGGNYLTLAAGDAIVVFYPQNTTYACVFRGMLQYADSAGSP